MTKKRITCILLGLAAALSAVFVGVLPQPFAPANAETFDYTADMQAKVAKLPKNDTENFYILSSESDSPTILTLYPYMDGEDRRVWGLRLFDTYENSIKDPPNLGLYTLYENSGYSSANEYLRFAFDYNASRGQRYAKAGHETSEPVQISNLGKSYSASKFLYIDKNFYPGGAYLLHYTNLPILPFSYYEKDGSTFTEEQRLTPVYTFHELSDYDGMPKGSFESR